MSGRELRVALLLCAILFALAWRGCPARGDDAPPPVNRRLCDLCRASVGKPVGDGQCAALPEVLLREAGGRPRGADDPGPGDYVWGELVVSFEPKAPPDFGRVRAGDVLQFHGTVWEFSRPGVKGRRTAAHHTAVVRGVDAEAGVLRVWHQNTNGVKVVVEDEYRVGDLVAGWVRVYRPQAK